MKKNYLREALRLKKRIERLYQNAPLGTGYSQASPFFDELIKLVKTASPNEQGVINSIRTDAQKLMDEMERDKDHSGK